MVTNSSRVFLGFSELLTVSNIRKTGAYTT